MNDNSFLVTAPNRPQAEMIASLLGEHNIPALLQPTSGLDIPGAYEMGPLRVLVAAEDLAAAREVLDGLDQSDHQEQEDYGKKLNRYNSKPGRIAAALGRLMFWA